MIQYGLPSSSFAGSPSDANGFVDIILLVETRSLDSVALYCKSIHLCSALPAPKEYMWDAGLSERRNT
jgi:hypothetical protein